MIQNQILSRFLNKILSNKLQKLPNHILA